jgi:hypothetical protein
MDRRTFSRYFEIIKFRKNKIPKLFKRAKVITILKLGKDGSDPTHSRPISLLSIVFKILERMILQRIQPLIDTVVPMSQAGFRKNPVLNKF